LVSVIGKVLRLDEDGLAPTGRSEDGRRIARWGVTAAAACGVVAATVQLVDFGVDHLRMRGLDMDTHASLFGVISLLALVAAAGVAGLIAAPKANPNRFAVVLPSLLMVLLALRLLHPTHVIFLALPIAAVTFVILWLHVGRQGSLAQRVTRGGCAMLVVSYLVHAFGTALSSALGYGEETWPTQIGLVVGHSAELAGWVVVATGLAVVYISDDRTSGSRTDGIAG
jgi:hypothetical protein